MTVSISGLPGHESYPLMPHVSIWDDPTITSVEITPSLISVWRGVKLQATFMPHAMHGRLVAEVEIG